MSMVPLEQSMEPAQRPYRSRRNGTQEPGKVADRVFANASAQTLLNDSEVDDQGETRGRTPSGGTVVSPEDIESAIESSRRLTDLFLKVSAGRFSIAAAYRRHGCHSAIHSLSAR